MNGHDNTQDLSHDAQLVVIRERVAEHDKMLKGNGSKGIYRSVIETGERMESMQSSSNRRFTRIERLLWSTVGGILILAISVIITYIRDIGTP